MIHTPPAHRHHGWFSFHWAATVLVGLLALGLGFDGSLKYAVEHHHEPSILDAIYYSLQMFLFHSPHLDTPVNLELQIARLLAPAISGLTALQAVLSLSYRRYRAFRLRFARGHTVICGLGRKGLNLALDCCHMGEQVVVIDSDANNALLNVCEMAGALILIGDAADGNRLAEASVQRASVFVAITGDDARNVEIAVSAWQLTQEKPEPHALRCFVHIVSPELRTLLRCHPMFGGAGSLFQPELFDAYANGARLLFQKHPLDRAPIGANGRRAAHLAVIAFGQMGESIVLQAAKIAHFSNGQKLRVTIFDLDAKIRRDNFLDRYPRFGNICDTEFITVRADDHHAAAEQLLRADTPDALTTCVICVDDESSGLSLGLNLAKKTEGRDIPILVRMSSRLGLAELLENECSGRLHAFGMVEDTCSQPILLNEELDAIARAIHADFVTKRAAEGRTPGDDPALAPWPVLREDFKNSNRQQADHLEVKMRAIGCRLSSEKENKAAVTQFTNEEVELLAQMEHARWNAERWLSGWTLGPKDVEKRISPYLVDWAQLEERIKEYDREAVRNIPKLVEKAGMGVYR